MKGNNKREFTRYTALIVIMIGIFTAIASKLFTLQVLRAEEFKEKANNRSIREIPDAAPRGNILDKNGVPLAVNTQSYVLVYNQTDESDKTFFDTMDKVFKILDENGEIQQDDFELKIDPFRFEFRSDDPQVKRTIELRFKKDRGLHEEISRKILDDKKGEVTKEEQQKIDEELLKITPEETFKKLVKQYKIDESKYPLDKQRRFMIVKDTLKMQSFSGYKPVVVASNIKKETAFKFLQMLNELPGIDVNTQPIRTYPNGEIGSAFLGYISKISSDQDKYQEKGYDTSTDYVGAAGIESVFEDRLKGSKGGRIVKLNKQGRIIEELGRREPYPGQSIQLTIDKDVQAAAEKSLDEVMTNLRNNPYNGDVNTSNATRGAAVAIDVNTGAVIALASRPGYDPNLFAAPGRLSSELYKKYFSPDLGEFGREYIYQRGLTGYYQGKSVEDVLNVLFPLDKGIENNTTIRQDTYDIYPKPFYNYATQSVVPPGSTFKPMTAIAGLESGVITPGYTIFDNGTFDMGGGHITHFAVGGYGPVDLAKGLEVSSNPYFMTVGKLMREAFGDDILAKYAWKFGLGAQPNSNVKPATGIEIPERFGQVFNSYSIKNIYASQYLWRTMETLKNGTDNRGSSYTAIDLYDDKGDSDKVKGIKSDLKKLIQESIKEGSKVFDKSKYRTLLQDLVSSDPKYSGKSINKKEIDSMIDAIYYVTVSDANSQLRVGANMYNASIGQGISNFTPLQMANFAATIANGGTRYKLHLVDKILNADGKVIEEVKPEVIEKTGVKPETLEAVRYGMSLVNSGEDGTAAQAFKGFPLKTAGKTGSATFSNSQDAFGRTSYGLYVGFAPYENPQIAVCAIVFDGGHGGFVAPVARAMYDAYFKLENGQNTDQNSNNAQNSGQNETSTNTDAQGNTENNGGNNSGNTEGQQ